MKHVLYTLALFAVACGSASAAETRVKCDFYKFEAAQKGVVGQRPSLIGPVSGTMTPIPLDAVYVTDKAIRRKVMPQEVLARRTPNGAVELVARLINCTDYPLEVQGRASFMDANQIPTENASAWQLVHIPPRSFATYREISIGTTQVASYVIELQGNK